jgi:Zn-dependent protease
MTQVFAFIVLIISVVIHEIAHGYAALSLGDPTAKHSGRLTLNPLAHIDIVGSILVPIITSLAGVPFGWAKPVPVNPYNLKNRRWGEALVAIAGPASNLAIAIIFGVLVRFSTSLPLITALALIAAVNVYLAVFNLIPVPPLDGSKVLFAIVPQRWLIGSQLRERLELYGPIALLILVFFGWGIVAPIFIHLFRLVTGLPL